VEKELARGHGGWAWMDECAQQAGMGVDTSYIPLVTFPFVSNEHYRDSSYRIMQRRYANVVLGFLHKVG
jgi:hypothetical protein